MSFTLYSPELGATTVIVPTEQASNPGFYQEMVDNVVDPIFQALEDGALHLNSVFIGDPEDSFGVVIPARSALVVDIPKVLRDGFGIGCIPLLVCRLSPLTSWRPLEVVYIGDNSPLGSGPTGLMIRQSQADGHIELCNNSEDYSLEVKGFLYFPKLHNTALGGQVT